MKKGYYAIIPANVRYDNDLRANSKLLYGEITALCNERGYCWASNSYFAELYEVSKETISRWVAELVEKGYITTELIYKEGGKEIVDRYIRISQDPIDEKDNRYRRNDQDPIDEKINTPIDEKIKGNNTSINNTVNNTLIPYVEIINYLNDVAGKQYRHSTRKTKDLIKARWNEGFTLDDFKQVIDIKNEEWKNNEKMNKFIRPETLFSPKFEGYLNQENKGTPSDNQFDDLF